MCRQAGRFSTVDSSPWLALIETEHASTATAGEREARKHTHTHTNHHLAGREQGRAGEETQQAHTHTHTGREGKSLAEHKCVPPVAASKGVPRENRAPAKTEFSRRYGTPPRGNTYINAPPKRRSKTHQAGTGGRDKTVE